MNKTDPHTPDQAPRRRGRRRGPPPAFVSGTSTEFLGRKPLPRTVQQRPLVFVLGPSGVGKSRVARRFFGPDAMLLSAQDILEHTQVRLLSGQWAPDIIHAERLILEGPCFLEQRPAFQDALSQLLQDRVRSHRRTIVTEAEDGVSVQRALLRVVPPEHRATVVLRFPVGRGRQRFAARVCDELGLPRDAVQLVKDLEPWTYERIYTVLRHALHQQNTQPDPTSRSR